MNTEFLMPQKYDGHNCGITVAICGLNENIKYDEMIIYIEGAEQDKHCVDISDNKFKTTKATFNDLEKNVYYNVIAEIRCNNDTQRIQTKIPASMTFNSETMNSLHNTESEINKKHHNNGLVETECDVEITFI